MVEPNENAINTAYDISGSGFSGNALSLADTSLTDVASIISAPDMYSPAPSTKDSMIEFSDRYISLDALNAKEDGSDLAYIRVLRFNNGKFGSQVFPLSTDKKELKYKEFIVTNLSKSNVEKAQILKTNNTLQIYSFDQQVEVLNIQGVLKSTISDRWDIAMVMLWDEVLRLSKLVERNMIVEFGYESNVYWGYPINFQQQKSSNTQFLVSYSMQFVVVKRSLLMKTSNPFLNDLMKQIQGINNVI